MRNIWVSYSSGQFSTWFSASLNSETMKQRDNVDGLILGGTELSLILREPTAAGLPVLDTTQIHVETAIEWMLRE